MSTSPIVTVMAVDCPVHGRVSAVYRPPCFWWECPQMVDCGFVVTKEEAAGAESDRLDCG